MMVWEVGLEGSKVGVVGGVFKQLGSCPRWWQYWVGQNVSSGGKSGENPNKLFGQLNNFLCDISKVSVSQSVQQG